MIDVKQWLDNGADPVKGIRLLAKYKASAILLRMYEKNPDKYAQNIKDAIIKLSGYTEQKIQLKPKTKDNSFRDQFPFLNSPTCPIELKALVTDKFSSFFAYKDLHFKLRDCTNLEECRKTAKELLVSYKENRSIYEELNFYKDNTRVLGKHPIFKQFRDIRKIREMSIKELVIKQQQLKHNIWRIQSEMKKGKKPHLDAERQESIKNKQAELAEVNRLLGE